MKALLLVSFGTSVNEARKNTIDRLVLEARDCLLYTSYTTQSNIINWKISNTQNINHTEENAE